MSTAESRYDRRSGGLAVIEDADQASARAGISYDVLLSRKRKLLILCSAPSEPDQVSRIFNVAQALQSFERL